ncbi:cytochrome P450 6B5-like [Galleria mellonella]|uniref:unspecific monooxygenase n=1 Tax=Galleria mellonella TaxID=7137 RepID=A0A6J1X4Q7_GALME|nr:cytochrome P450 6B5-like [Galleria mellonella]
MFVVITLLIVLTIIIYINFIGKYNEKYWKKRGVKLYEDNKILGIYWKLLTKNRALFLQLSDIYKQYAGDPAVGVASLFTPTLYVIDPENVHHVMHTDFPAFNHRGFIVNEDDPLSDSILQMNGVRWKLMRQNMTPLFTSAKLKNMFYIIEKSSRDFVEYLKQNPDKLKGDTYNTLTIFCCKAIGATVFGIDTKPEIISPFFKAIRDSFRPSLWNSTRYTIMMASPRLFTLLRLKQLATFKTFFINAIKQILRRREQENSRKYDFADICVSIQQRGMMTDQDTGYELVPTDELLAAQGFFFFSAGVEPIATAIFSVLIQLGKHLDILQRVQLEIDEIYRKYDGQISYDAIIETEYLDKVINESLRLHTPINFIIRHCERESVLPVGNIKVEKGTKLYLPIRDFHLDPKYFPNPHTFDPERNLIQHGSETVYIPFGKGPRGCIGVRYARLQMKTALVHLLQHFNVKTITNEKQPSFICDIFQLRFKNIDVKLSARI